MVILTAEAPVNIALIKYWGKVDEQLHLPANPSLSLTLASLKTITQVRSDASLPESFTSLRLNGEEQQVIPDKMVRLISLLREERRKKELLLNREEQEARSSWGLEIISKNNFPTSAGLASSASGYACLVYLLGQLWELDHLSAEALSGYARLGSGSACRSLHGGLVLWPGGGEQAVQVAPASFWPELRVLAVVVSTAKKEMSSRRGMKICRETCPFFPARLDQIPARLARLTTAMLAKDLGEAAGLIKQDSNEMHACCLASTPAFFYLSDVSLQIIQMVESHFSHLCAYTFDAGPNAFLICSSETVQPILERLLLTFPPSSSSDSRDSRDSWDSREELSFLGDWPDECASLLSRNPGRGRRIKQIWCSTLGNGPIVVPNDLM